MVSPWLSNRPTPDGHVWPALTRGPAAALETLVRQIEEIQWLSPFEIEALQFSQLPIVAAWCAEHSPLFARHLGDAGLTPQELTSPAALRRLPLLVRRHLQIGGNSETYCSKMPEGHEPVVEVRSSGSTGEPACAKRTRVNQLFWMAHTMREYLWHGDDFANRVAVVRASVTDYSEIANWGAPAAALFRTGPSALLPLRADVKQRSSVPMRCWSIQASSMP